MTEKLFSAFPALKNTKYRWYILAQLISLVGTWIQVVAQGWLAFQLTHSAFWVGLISALGFLPILLFGLFAGVVVDRLPKKELYLWTQILELISAAVLGILTLTGFINPVLLAIISFATGVVAALDNPVRFAFLAELVEKEELTSAIALNSGAFNTARVIGPAFSGALIALIGTGGAFLTNALSFLPPIFALWLIPFPPHTDQKHPHPLESLKLGISYSFTHPLLKYLLVYVGIIAIFGWSYATIMPVITDNIFHKGADTLGVLFAASGLGSILGSMLLPILSKKLHTNSLISGGGLIFVIFIFFFTLTNNLNFALLMLFFSGLGLAIQNTILTTTVQHEVAPQLRGRVMSIYLMMFIGLSPVGSVQIGFVAEHFGSVVAMRLNAVVLLAAILTLFFYFRKQKID